ncbi:glutamate receptor ionotropic, delta-2-like [Vespa velutina]|uniref:glutamate receptor ionotropic, delta-2-like n=1 Tax=Vespa velutina TaxID=202808 RepID=UPI001FB3DD4C|nr:glutamate receptor ionotropic, delta-2-like [Vespa velutina]
MSEFRSLRRVKFPMINIGVYQRASYIGDLFLIDLRFSKIIHNWARLFSHEKIPFIGLHISNMPKTSFYRYKITRPLYVVILFDDQSVEEFSNASSIFNMSFPVWYVIFLPGNYRQNYCHEKSRNLFNVRFNTEMLVTCPYDNITREWYSLRENQTETLDLAILKSDGTFNFLTNLSLNYRRKNMNGLSLKTVVVEDSPYIEVEKNGTLSGLFGDVLSELSETANFTLNIVKFVKEYGRWDEKKKIWTGAVGEIASGRADISISEFSLTNSRLNVVDYIAPIIISPLHFYIKDPLLYGTKWTGHFKVFDLKIWIFIIVIISTAPSLVSILKMTENPKRGTHQVISMILENYLQFWGIFCQQGLAAFPYRLSLRLAYFSTFLSAFIVFAAYSGTLVSFLTNSVRILPFRSLEELVNDGTYQVIVYKGGADYDMFAYGNDSLSKRIMKIMRKEEKLPNTALEGISQVCNERRVTFLTSVEVQLSFHNHSLCNIVSINSGQIITLAMILTKNNPFTDLINHHMNQLFYNGVINRLKTKNMKMMKYDGSTYKSISFRSIYPIIDLLKIGLAISICILIIELLFQKVYFSFYEKKHIRIEKRIDENLRRFNRLNYRKDNFIS